MPLGYLGEKLSNKWEEKNTEGSEVEAYIGCCRNIKEYNISDWSEPQV